MSTKMCKSKLPDLDEGLRRAVKHFWKSKAGAFKKGGKKDQGQRGSVTSGGHLDGFSSLVAKCIATTGILGKSVYTSRSADLPGYFRPSKQWDLIVVDNGELLACVEFKSHVGSFSNNFNNRAEEAVGNAADLNAAYREGAFKPGKKPWLGYLMLLESATKSTQPVRVKEPHFRVFDEFQNTSYAQRYEQLIVRLLRERLYDSGCLIMAREGDRRTGAYSEPCEELLFRSFIEGLCAKLIAHQSFNK